MSTLVKKINDLVFKWYEQRMLHLMQFLNFSSYTVVCRTVHIDLCSLASF